MSFAFPLLLAMPSTRMSTSLVRRDRYRMKMLRVGYIDKPQTGTSLARPVIARAQINIAKVG